MKILSYYILIFLFARSGSAFGFGLRWGFCDRNRSGIVCLCGFHGCLGSPFVDQGDDHINICQNNRNDHNDDGVLHLVEIVLEELIPTTQAYQVTHHKQRPSPHLVDRLKLRSER